ncbi:MAG: glycoside hydrolase family 113 [Ktedonobacteraceae bacterium]
MYKGNGEKHVSTSRPLAPSPQKKRGRFAYISKFKQYALVFLILAVLLLTGWQVFLYVKTMSNASLPAGSKPVGVNSSQAHEDKTVSVRPTPPAIHYQRPNFEAGIVFPQWSSDGYGTHWQQQLPTIQGQTGARWIEMTIFFSQATTSSTQVRTNVSTPTLQSLMAGIRAAHALGYHVFIAPLMGVDTPADQWAGTIRFSTYQEEAQWFDSYWETWEPYAEAAAEAGADQLAIGTELVWLQQYAPSDLWNTLIARMRSVFPGVLTYNMNWTSLKQPAPGWMVNTQLAMIGVSEYQPLANDHIRVDPRNIIGLWKTHIKFALDAFSLHLHKPMIISEIGYRNSADTLYKSWLPYSALSQPDPAEQAAACNAALANVIPDPHIVGIFFWGWDGVDDFKLAGQPAAGVLNRWYTSSQS